VTGPRESKEPGAYEWTLTMLRLCLRAFIRIRNNRPLQYFNNVLEQDHRAIKRRVRASQHFRSFWAAWRTIAGYEAIHMIRKGQAYGNAAAAKVRMLHRFILGLFAATS
jgi:IS6 family transposase